MKLGQRVWFINKYNKPEVGNICYISKCGQRSGDWFDKDEAGDDDDIMIFRVNCANNKAVTEKHRSQVFSSREECLAAIVSSLLKS